MSKKEEQEKTTVTTIVDTVLREAITAQASDIHFEPERDFFNVRFRIDGFLHQIRQIEKSAQEEFVSRIKVLARMDIMEHRLPQDGHLEVYDGGKIYNIRVSTFPTLYGEALVLRLFIRKDEMLDLNTLGFEEDQLKLTKDIIKSPYGIILITGPTASGKTTLLYSILRALNTGEKNIVTIEDPIEFQMTRIRQLEIRDSIGLTFSKALRVIARQNPDVVMIGEIRDEEVAQMAANTALSGVLVFSTFHTFDVPGVVIRLLEMKIPLSVVAHVITGIFSTRLVRKICESCKIEYEITDAETAVFEKSALTTPRVLYKGKGCQHCKWTGYSGQTGIFRVIRFDNDMRAFLLEGNQPSKLQKLLEEKHIKTLWDAALIKIVRGDTTFEEAFRVLGMPFMSRDI